jgi:hypothetical protein
MSNAAPGLSEHETKMLQLQYQMKENNLYMEDTFKDLDSWTKEIKEKEKKVLEDPNYLKNQNKGLPPIRALATTKKKKKVKKAVTDNHNKHEQEAKPKTKKLNSYDYRSWDKIDVVCGLLSE